MHITQVRDVNGQINFKGTLPEVQFTAPVEIDLLGGLDSGDEEEGEMVQEMDGEVVGELNGEASDELDEEAEEMIRALDKDIAILENVQKKVATTKRAVEV